MQKFSAHSTSRPLLKAFQDTLTAMGFGVGGTPPTPYDDHVIVYAHKKKTDIMNHRGVDTERVFELPAEWDEAIKAAEEVMKPEPYAPAFKGMVKITAEQLRMKLQSPVPVRFTFTKKDGQIRHAIGTRYIDNIPGSAAPTGSRAESKTAINYYDYTVQGWRSISKDTEIYVDTNF
jgi:hypothetical protein